MVEKLRTEANVDEGVTSGLVCEVVDVELNASVKLRDRPDADDGASDDELPETDTRDD